MQSKITWYKKKQENLNLHGNKKTKDLNAETTLMLGLYDRDFKAAIIQVF